jgi:hypothetical protein
MNISFEKINVSFQSELLDSQSFLLLKNKMQKSGVNFSNENSAIIFFCKDYKKSDVKDGCWYFYPSELEEELSNEFGNCFKVDFNDSENIFKLFPYISKAHFKNLKTKTITDSYEGYKSLLKDSLTFLNNNLEEDKSVIGSTDFSDLYLDLLRLGYQAANSKDLSEYLSRISTFFEAHKLAKKIEIIDEKEIDKYIYQQEEILLFPLISQQGEKLALVTINSELDSGHVSFGLNFILRSLEKFLARKGEGQEQDSERIIWEESFLGLPFPVALISSDNELLIHNAAFSKLELFPSECMQFTHNQKLEAAGMIFKVLRIELVTKKGNTSYFIFVSEKNITESLGNGANLKNISSEELGIISSSIAHELNNPLAGILAAITLLGLEDDWDDENEKTLADMNNGAKRCKELIEIFLGFSKASPLGKAVGSWQNSFEQARNLLRFRMIESNVRLDFKYDELDFFGKEVNGSVVSMIFYILLSETMTSFAHLKLIMSDEEKNDVIEGHIVESNRSLKIEVNHGLDLASKLISSKLIQHLLDIENLKIEGENNRLLIRCVD